MNPTVAADIGAVSRLGYDTYLSIDVGRGDVVPSPRRRDGKGCADTYGERQRKKDRIAKPSPSPNPASRGCVEVLP
jgi:hypothetical protein